MYLHVPCSISHKAKRKERPRYPSADEWMRKVWCYMHTRKYYSALQRKMIRTHATTCGSLEDIMLYEINPSQKDKWFHLHEVPRVVKFLATKLRMVVARAGG